MASTWNQIRRVTRKANTYAGHAQAASRGRLWQRLVNWLLGRGIGRGMRKVWR